MIARISIPYRPEPVPPGEISPSSMFSSSTPPPSPVYEECVESMAPVDVMVVDTANIADSGIPNRTSLPSVAAPAACSATPGWAFSTAIVATRAPVHSTTIAARIA